uniref:E3 ubiquitin-protein ligase parkin n=1 Tax=Astatotilapia calliptera TaxID=8154 RepID=A0AAX7VV30_ASTCA
MIVFVRFNLGPGVPVELQEEASVAQLKEVVGSQQGVRPERLKVLFAGRELQSTATLQGCDLPEQSTVHVVLPPSGASFQRLMQEHRAEDGEEEQEQGSLTRLDLSSSRLPANSEGGEGRAEGESLKEVQAGAHSIGCDDSLIKEVHHFRILGDEQYGRYLQYGAEECLLTTGGMMCPSPGCGAGLLPPDGRRKLECDRRLGCGFVFCRLCRGEYHEGACQAVTAPPTGEAAQGFVVGEEASLMGRWEPASLLVIAESTRPCPTCSVPVERNGGCMHMHCPLCKAEWCWLCGVPWNRECMGNHWFS